MIGRIMTLAAVVVGLGPAAVASSPITQGGNSPIVQMICQVGGGATKTVRITYPVSPVIHDHVFKPVAGGPDLVFQELTTQSQVYTLAVPAGRYRLHYGHWAAPKTLYNPVVVVQPFTVRGRICERGQQLGGPVS